MYIVGLFESHGLFAVILGIFYGMDLNMVLNRTKMIRIPINKIKAQSNLLKYLINVNKGVLILH